MRRRRMMQKVSRISLCVVVGLLFLALIWKFAGAQLAKRGIVLSNDTAAKTVSETAPEAEDGSGNAGIKKLAETTPPNETPGWQYGAQATFFMLGSNVEKYGADVIPRMAAIGCELGNHSYAHPNMKELSTDDGLAQFQMTDDLIAQYNNGQGATVIRFPYGNSTDELLASIGRPSIMWDVDTLDWQTKNVQANISAVLDSVSPGDIILMHDIHETTVESCATIVPELINRGYELVTIHTLAAANGVDLAAGETYYGFHGGTTNE